MATHALISRKKGDSIETRFVYWDGDSVMNTLNMFYNEEKDLQRIFNGNDFSILGENEYFSERKEDIMYGDFSSMQEMQEYLMKIDDSLNKLKYFYYFDTTNKQWFVISGETNYKWTPFSKLVKTGKLKDCSSFYPKKEAYLKALDFLFPKYYDKKEHNVFYYDSLVEEDFWVSKTKKFGYDIYHRPFSPSRKGDKCSIAVNVVLR